MKDALIVTVLSVLPRKRGARTMGWIARTRASRLMTRLFVRAYRVDLAEAEGTLRDYPSLEALFTRRLREGLRPVDAAPDAVVSPVDGTCAAVGRTAGGEIEIAPGRSLDIAALLDETVAGERDVVVLYLSPKDYHRVHVPREGVATRWRYLPGTLWPVFPAAVRRVRGLFQRNERVAIHVRTDAGPMAVVLVGAFGVGRITTPVVADLVTNCGRRAAASEGDCGVRLDRGAELGTFHLGSTVVLVTEPGRWTWSVRRGEPVRVGEAIGRAVRRLEA